MTKRMLIDATQPEETRIAVVEKDRLDTYDFDSVARKQIKGNIFLAKVTRVEPSLQACFVEYGGNRQGFLAFTEIHPDYYRIPVEDRQALLAEEAQSWDEEDEEGDETAPRRDRENGEQPSFDHEAGPENGLNDEDVSAEHATSEVGEQPALPIDAYADETAQQTMNLTRENDDASIASDELEPLPEAANLTEVARDNTIEAVGGAEDEAADNGRPRRMGRLRRRYKIQEVIKRRQIMLVQAVKEERGQKGAAMTTYISLPGRYCVLMPNSPRGGGVSRKITDPQARRKMKDLLSELDVPQGMSVILRTAGMTRTRLEVKRDLEYLLRLWDEIRRETLQSVAPSMIYEEADIFKRAIRDLYSPDAGEIIVAGEEGFRKIKKHMRQMVPAHAKKVLYYRDPLVPLFQRYGIEPQIADIFNPRVELRSGGYIIINPTEALVSIDVNSGKATRERHIDDTALKTNMEAAEEIARQLRLRDLGGLVVIDFIDMEAPRHNAKVERKLREAMASDRARIEIGRISGFGLLELSRQRLHPSLTETHFETCPHCNGTSLVRTIESAAVVVMRAIEAEAVKGRAIHITANIPQHVAIYILNHKREEIIRIEEFFGCRVSLRADEKLMPNDMNITFEKGTPVPRQKIDLLPVPELDGEDPVIAEDDLQDDVPMFTDGEIEREQNGGEEGENRRERGERGGDRGDRRGGRNRSRGGRNRSRDRDGRRERQSAEPQTDAEGNVIHIPITDGSDTGVPQAADGLGGSPEAIANPSAEQGEGNERRGNRRGRRHPYRRGRGGRNRDGQGQQNSNGGDSASSEGHASEQRSFEPRAPREREAIPSNDAPKPAREKVSASAEGGEKESGKRGWWQKLIE